jgi:hypothetical protein
VSSWFCLKKISLLRLPALVLARLHEDPDDYRYVHPAEEQKKIAAGKLEAFRIAGMVQAIQKRQAVTTIPTKVN